MLVTQADKMHRLFSMYKLLDEAVSRKSFSIDEEVVVVVITVSMLRTALNIPDNLGFADAKHRYLGPLLKDINEHSQLNLSIVDERKMDKKVNLLSFKVSSVSLTPAEVLNQITKFRKKLSH